MLHSQKNASHQGEARFVTPKEERHFGKRISRSTSKNAKDKSNSATLRASQCTTHRHLLGMENMSRRTSHCDSEKDSGYSEAGSDTLQNDTDEQLSSVSGHQRESDSGCNKNCGDAPGCLNMPPYEELTPIYVIKNLLLKPSRPEQLMHNRLAWGRGWHSLTGTKAPAQLLLIQQPPIPTPTSSSPTVSTSVAVPQGQPKKGVRRSKKNHSSKLSYLPILNSYPRIAPHPRKDGHDKGKGVPAAGTCKESGGHSLSKRVCTEEEKMEAVSTTSHLLTPRQLQNQREGSQPRFKNRSNHSSSHNPPHHPLTTASPATQHKTHRRHHNSRSASVGSPSVTSSHTSSPPAFSDSPPSSSPSSSSSSVSHRPYRPAPDDAATHSFSNSQSECSSVRQRRFLNTAEILNQSGLLNITLRTKELLQQSAAAEREIAQLRQHALLLCQIAQAGQQGSSDSANTLDKLLQAMSQSGSYPNLDPNKFKVLCDRHPQAEKGDEGDEKRERGRRKSKADNSAPQPLVSLSDLFEGISQPSPLFAPSPEAERIEPADSMSCRSAYPPARPPPDQGCRQAGLDNALTDLIMIPESSSHNNYLL